jgi:isopenicillin-N N-acyltransferase like protein
MTLPSALARRAPLAVVAPFALTALALARPISEAGATSTPPANGVPTSERAPDAKPFRYKDGEHGEGKLMHVDGVPVLILEGSPEQVGEEIGVLAVRQSKPLYDFPRDYFRRECTAMIRGAFPKLTEDKSRAMEELLWPKFQKVAMKLEPNFPKAHRAELEALIKAGEVDRDHLVASNGMFDLGHLPQAELLGGCSSLIIPARRSATKGPLFGRNLDFSHFGYLHRYSLLMVHRSNDPKKHSFTSAGFPGFVGCFTGMNDAGLTIASHEVFEPDTATRFNPKGVPFAMAYRRVLEECETIGDAVKLLDGIERASATSLVIADPEGGAVIEVTPDTLAVRRFKDKPGVCTNHFCTQKNPKQTDKFETRTRFDTLSRSVAGEKAESFSVKDVTKCLHEVRLLDSGKTDLTIQTFVFEPAERRVHLRFAGGDGPATGGKLTTLDLNKLWGK